MASDLSSSQEQQQQQYGSRESSSSAEFDQPYSMANGSTPAIAADKSCAHLDTLFHGLNNYFRDEDILDKSEHSPAWLGTLILSAYVLVIVFGTVGNLLTISAVIRNKQMRTVRNFFILNLALSDFFVCTVTAPTTLYTVLYVFWPFGKTLCKIAGSLQGFNIFLSTFSITAIALDRYVLVIFPTKRQRQQRLSLIFFSLIWLASILLAAPLFLAADLSPVFRDDQCAIELNLCNEQNERWKELLLSKEAYTLGVIILQYLLPLVAIAFAYSRIARRMGARRNRTGSSGDSRKGSGGMQINIGSKRQSLCPAMLPPNGASVVVNQANGTPSKVANGNGTAAVSSPEALVNQRRKSVADRHRRTNMLLVVLVVVFACAWLPLNFFHLFNTLSESASFSVPIFAVCHLIAMCSACLNPCCYAFFNNNFRQEFVALYRNLGLIWIYRRITSLAKLIGLNRASSAERHRLHVPQTRTEFAPSMIVHQKLEEDSTQLAVPHRDHRRVSIQPQHQTGFRMDF